MADDKLQNIEGSGFTKPNEGTPPAGNPPAPTPGVDEIVAKKYAAILDELNTAKTALQTEMGKSKEYAEKIAKIDADTKAAERAKLSEMDRFKADIADLSGQIKELVTVNVNLQNQISAEKFTNTKNAMIGSSGLRPEFHKHVRGTTAAEVQADIDEFLGIQKNLKTDALGEVPPVLRESNVGAPPAVPTGKEPPVDGSGKTTNRYESLKSVKDVRQLSSVFQNDPQAFDMLKGKQ